MSYVPQHDFLILLSVNSMQSRKEKPTNSPRDPPTVPRIPLKSYTLYSSCTVTSELSIFTLHTCLCVLLKGVIAWTSEMNIECCIGFDLKLLWSAVSNQTLRLWLKSSNSGSYIHVTQLGLHPEFLMPKRYVSWTMASASGLENVPIFTNVLYFKRVILPGYCKYPPWNLEKFEQISLPVLTSLLMWWGRLQGRFSLNLALTWSSIHSYWL